MREITKHELFKKYSINKSHSKWDNKIDNWISVELFRVMHNGNLPESNDMSVKWITDFLDKVHHNKKFMNKMMKRDDFGSLYLTAKRMVHSLSEQILKELNK